MTTFDEIDHKITPQVAFNALRESVKAIRNIAARRTICEADEQDLRLIAISLDAISAVMKTWKLANFTNGAVHYGGVSKGGGK